MTTAAIVMRPSPSGAFAAALLKPVRRIGPLGTIILLHVAFFYALQSGLLRQAAEVLPKEVTVTFITPQPKAEAPKPQPAPEKPKTVPVVKKQVTPPPPVPVVTTKPAPAALTAPPAPPAPPTPPAPAEPAPPVAAAPSAPPAPVVPKTVTSGIEYVQAPQPDYPPVSRRMGEEGKTVLRVLVNEKGRPERVEVQKTSGSARLDEAARQAVLRAVFKPFIEDGKAVPAFAIIPIKFQLDN